jgi:hypothetical protein
LKEVPIAGAALCPLLKLNQTQKKMNKPKAPRNPLSDPETEVESNSEVKPKPKTSSNPFDPNFTPVVYDGSRQGGKR